MAQRDLKVTLIGEDKTGKAFGSAGSSADGIGAKFKTFGAAAATGIGAAAVGVGLFAKSGVDAFARIEDATGAAGVQFGKASTDVVKFAETASANFGLSTGAALDAANTFGTMGKAAGLSGSDLAGFSTKFVGLAGDMASFKGTSPEQAIEAIGAALRGETEPIRAYGVLLDDASMRQEALALGLIKTTKEALTPQQKVLAAQSLIYKQTNDAQGDFARTSDSTANTAKRLAAETENASAKLGQQLAPAVTVAREAFLKLIEGASGLVTHVGPAIGKAQEAFSNFAGKAMPVVKTAFGELVDAFKAVGDAIMATVDFFREHDDAAKALGAVAAAVAAGIAAAWVAQAAVATVNAAKSVLAWFATATASTTSATIQSKSTAQIVVGWVAASAGAAASVAKQVASWVLLGAQSLLNAAKVAAAWLIAMGPIALVVAAVVALAAVVIKNWDTIKTTITNAASAVLNFLKANWPIILSVMTGPIGAIVIAIVRNWDAIKGAFSAGVNASVGFVRELPGKVLSAVSGFSSLLVNAGRELMSGLARGIGDRISAVVDKVRAAAQKIKDLLPGSPVKTGPLTAWNGGGAGKRLMGMLGDGITKGAPGVARAMDRAVDFGDLAGMYAGLPTAGGADVGSGFVTSRLAATAATAPVEQVTRNYNLTISGTLDPAMSEESIMAALRRMEMLAG